MSQRYIGGLIYNPPGGFSGFFDGSGDYLDAGSNAALGFGTGDFTVEAWIYRSASGAFPIYTNGPTSSGSWAVYVVSDKLQTDYYGGTSLTGASTIPLNTWNHVAVVRSGSTLSLYLNGNRDATTTTSSNNTTSNGIVGRDWTNSSTSPNGYISNLRVVKGSAVYSGTSYTVPTSQLTAISGTSLLTCAYPTFRDGSSNNFTITVNGNTAVSTQNPFPQTQLPNPALGNQGNGVYSMSQYQALRSQNLWPAIDPYFDFVTLMLHGNGTNGAQNNTFLDSSTNNFTITRNGNTTQGTFTPYGSNWSNYFNGTDAWLSIGSNAAFGMGTGDCTIECWYYPLNHTSGNQVLIDLRTTNTAIPFAMGVLNGTGAPYAYNGTAYSGGVVANNAWNHIAFVRSGSGTNNCKLYLNGSQVAQFTDTNNWGSAQTCAIGRNTAFNGEFAFGYLSNVRIVKGSAVYTTAFTPPSAPLAVISGTSLLTCADNRFIDDSTNAFAITVNGSPSVQRFSPFNPTTPYAAGTIGGSGYFDGSGDYLSVADNAALDLSTGDFTIECWVFPITGISDVDGVISKRSQSTFTGGDWRIAYRSASTAFGIATGSNNTDRLTPAIALNAWNHIAFVRSSGTLSCYANGARGDNLTWNENLDNGEALLIGLNTAGNDFPGYISNVRIVKGSAVYSGSTYTVPTAPLTAITNTSLLLNFTNGGIIDNAMMNNLETVGNAQISTSVSKFGGGSMAFDGSGDALRALTTPNLIYGSGDVTIEAWVYLNTIAGSPQVIVDTRASSAGSELLNFQFQSGVLYVYAGAYSLATELIAGTSAISTTTWTHVAFVRSSGTNRLFVNGTQQSSNTNAWTQVLNSGTLTSVGMVATSTGNPMNGYIDDLRITKGYARYTANFTPQRSQWQDQ